MSDKQEVTAKDMAQTLGLSRAFLLKLIGTLKKEGLITTLQGKGGGVRLAKEDCTLWDIVTPFDNLGRYEKYLDRNSRCFAMECPLHQFWNDITIQIFQRLRDTKLMDLARFYRSHGLDDLSLKQLPWFGKAAAVH